MSTTGARKFEATLEIAAPRDAVWRALTEDRELRRWFAIDAAVEPGVGGEVVWAWGDTHRWPQRIELWEPGQRLRTKYDAAATAADGSPHPLFLDFELEGEGGTTTLRLVHSGFGPGTEFDEEFDGISRGWQLELRSLRHYLENHHGKDRHVAWCTAGVGDDGDAAWQALCGPEGFGCGDRIAELAEGDPFAFTAADGTRFEGRVLRCAPREFSGVATSHGDAYLRFCIERCGGPLTAWVWLGSYADDRGAQAATAQAAFESMLRDLYGDASLRDVQAEQGA